MMSEPDLLKRELDAITHVLSAFPAIEEAILFGSRAMGRASAGSDVDIALKGHELSRETVTMVSSQLNEETFMPYRFDVLAYAAISNEELRAHIDRVGIVIYRA